MDQDKVWREFAKLPPEAQQQVADFIGFLSTHYKRAHRKTGRQTSLADEPFIGMWRDREDMQDSSAWVRSVREREWVKSRD